MKIAYLERALIPTGLLEQRSASSIAVLLKDLLRRGSNHRGNQHELSYWQRIFLQSKVNGCFYFGDALPQTQWRWPSNTWLQIRLNHLKGLDREAVGHKAELHTIPVTPAHARKPHSLHIVAPPCC